MPDFTPSNYPALGVQVPSAMTTMQGMIGAQQGMQNLQQGAQQIQRGGVALKQESMDLEERNKINEVIKNLDQFKTEQGDPDYGKLADALFKASPKLGPEKMKQIAGAHTDMLMAQRSKQELNQQTLENVARLGAVVGTTTPEMADSLITGYGEQQPLALPLLAQLRKRLLHAGDNPEARKAAGLEWAKQALSVPQQIEAATPSGPTVSTIDASGRPATGVINLKPSAGPTGLVAGATAPQTLPVGELETVQFNPQTQSPFTVTKNAQGNVVSPRGEAPKQLQPGEAQEIPIRTQQRVAVNAAAAKVPEQRFNNKQIMELAPQAFVGTGGDQLTKLGSAVGVQMLPGDHAGNMQRLGHFMALQAQANAQAMGAGTDQARAIAEQASGSTKWTPEAIISTAKVNDALSTGVDLFNRGMESAIKKNGGNVLAVRDFQNAWSQNFDPQAIMLHNAIQAKDKGEVDKIVKSVGGKGSAGAHNLAAKLKNMETLVKDGGL